MNNPDKQKIEEVKRKLAEQNKEAARQLLLAMQNQVVRVKIGVSR